jgi:glycosyltransferase involved in cell wall biosynthesis
MAEARASGPISVIIPAYNEAKVIGRCLSSMLEGAAPGELEIIVACNGCKDDSAGIARSFGPPVRVIELAEASKVAALNAGDAAATSFPRFYVDADIELSIEAIRETAKVLAGGHALAAAPRMEIDDRDRSWLIRAYYRVWTRLPFFDDGMIGTGVYALAEAGRKRFDRFPDVIADDGFVYLQYAPGERVTVRSCSFTVRPPRTLVGLFKIFTRVRAGAHELEARFPELSSRWMVDYGSSLRRVLSSPSLWPAAPVYAAVVVATKLAGRRRARQRVTSWTPEESSRE